MIYLWAAAVIVFMIIEIATTQLVTLWFALGSLASLIACLMNAPVYVQIIIFVAVSAITLAATRPLVKKWTKTPFSPTNADRCIGKTALVVEDIDNSAEKGAVKINGSVWSARSADGIKIRKDEQVTIKQIDGVKLIVNKN